MKRYFRIHIFAYIFTRSRLLHYKTNIRTSALRIFIMKKHEKSLRNLQKKKKSNPQITIVREFLMSINGRLIHLAPLTDYWLDDQAMQAIIYKEIEEMGKEKNDICYIFNTFVWSRLIYGLQGGHIPQPAKRYENCQISIWPGHQEEKVSFFPSRNLYKRNSSANSNRSSLTPFTENICSYRSSARDIGISQL